MAVRPVPRDRFYFGAVACTVMCPTPPETEKLVHVPLRSALSHPLGTVIGASLH